MSYSYLSIIIPTKNRATDLTITLRSVFAQTRLPDEIVIVDQSNSNDAQRSVEELISELQMQPKIIYLHDEHICGASQARNKGFENCQGTHILILDDDVTLQPNYIETCLSKMQNTTWLDGIAGYRQVPGEKLLRTRLFWLGLFYVGPFRYYFQNMHVTFRASKKNIRNVLYKLDAIGGGWFLIKREVFEHIKYDENLIGICEDQDYFLRASSKFKFALTPETYVIHRKSTANSYLINRVKNKDHHECKMLSMGYLFKKNLSGTFINGLCYGWLCIGLFLDAVRSSLFSFSFGPIKGTLMGLYKILHGFKGAPILIQENLKSCSIVK
ncbi:MAG: glycosyltransferase family 2 protein [bacterium]